MCMSKYIAGIISIHNHLNTRTFSTFPNENRSLSCANIRNSIYPRRIDLLRTQMRGNLRMESVINVSQKFKTVLSKSFQNLLKKIE